MPELEFDPVDHATAGAVGVPGRRAFYIQATKDGQTVAVLVEKEQVAMLSARLGRLLDEVATRLAGGEDEVAAAEVSGDPVPLFRAVAIGIGFDPDRRMVLIELHEHPTGAGDDDAEEGEDDGEEEAGGGDLPEGPGPDGEEVEGWLARLYLSPGQARAMARVGAASVMAGRPPCSLCGNPLDPDGHTCPKLNGHRH